MSTADIVKAGAASGMKIGTSLIYAVKGRLGGAGATTRGRRGKPRSKDGKVSASDFVRSMPATMKASEIVAAAKAKGIKVSTNLVYMVRSTAKRNASGIGHWTARRTGRAAAPSNGDLAAFKRLALGLGITTARRALDELERGLAALLG